MGRLNEVTSGPSQNDQVRCSVQACGVCDQGPVFEPTVTPNRQTVLFVYQQTLHVAQMSRLRDPRADASKALVLWLSQAMQTNAASRQQTRFRDPNPESMQVFPIEND